MLYMQILQTTGQQRNETDRIKDLKFAGDPVLFGRHIVELRASDNTLVRSYSWGLDLSGTMDGAGGVGGLLWVTLHTASGPAAGTHFAAYDGNGNIVALSAASDGSETARYEYGPFGEPIRVTGPAATNNPFRFSTKRTDSTTDLVLYEYRVYQPSTGRWLSRDAIEERGASSGFCRNDPVCKVDLFGLVEFRFEVVKGPRMLGFGEWGNPSEFAFGEYHVGDAEAWSRVTVVAPPDAPKRWSCNTINSPYPAGTVLMKARTEKCESLGVYNISVYWQVSATGHGYGGVAEVRVVDAEGRDVFYDDGDEKKPIGTEGSFTEEVRLDRNWKVVASYEPTLGARHRGASATAFGMLRKD